MADYNPKSFEDIKNILNKQLEDINRKNIEQEKVRHDRFLEKHEAKSEKLDDKHASYISQLITLEGVIFTAIIVFVKPEDITIWLILSICLILLSLILGIWKQNIATQSDYQSQEWNYQQEMKNNWFIRELWKDESVKTEKELIEPHLKGRENAYKKTFTYKILKKIHLTHDRIENLFKITFLLALFFLIMHFVSFSFTNKTSKQQDIYPHTFNIWR